MTALFETLGCKVNQYETQAMERLLVDRGHRLAAPGEVPDVCVVNTCAVTAAAGQKSRQAVRRLRRTYPAAFIAVCGCFSQVQPEDAEKLNADFVAGTGNRTAFLDALEQAVTDRRSASKPDIPAPGGAFEVLPAVRSERRTRAMLKVEDGCDNFCAYCVIPYARGRVRSLPLETAVCQAESLAGDGIREIVLTGIEISSWGKDLPGKPALIDLVEALSAAVPDTRLRLGSLEPRTVTEDFCARAAALPNLCPQFHLSLQSGCDATLRRMRRRYDTARYRDAVAWLRRSFRRPAVTTDLITGFPGETDEEFNETLAFLREIRFAKVHVFPYSERPGTPAASMPGIPKNVREARARTASQIAAETRAAYLSECVGERYPVLFEQPKGSQFSGHAPNYMEVLVEGENLQNEIRAVRITAADGDALYGVVE